jgi:hypothetical protein
MRRLLIIVMTCGGLLWAQSPAAEPKQDAGRAPITIRFKPLPRELLQQRLSLLRKTSPERQFVLEGLLSTSGCGIKRLEVKDHEPNVVCSLAGSSEKVIVLGAHYDHATKGDGAVDNWSGSALLPSIYDSMKDLKLRHTIVFVGFSAEEKGLLGSKAYVTSLAPDERRKISAMVNLDTLGLSSTKVWSNRASPLLVNSLAAVAQALKLPLEPINVDAKGASADSEPFFTADIPAITIHSVTMDTWNILHTSRDTLEQVKLNDYYETYRLITGYLIFLDQLLDAEPVPGGAGPS